jgi:hypothetical protein
MKIMHVMEYEGNTEEQEFHVSESEANPTTDDEALNSSRNKLVKTKTFHCAGASAYLCILRTSCLNSS